MLLMQQSVNSDIPPISANTDRPRRAIWMYAGLVIILLVGIGAWYYSYSSMNLFTTIYKNALKVHRSGDYTAAIAIFNQAANEAPDKGAEGRAREMVAFEMFLRNEGSDRDQAIQIYKEIINDSAYPPSIRALALADIALLTSEQGNTFAKQYFSQEPSNYYTAYPANSRYDIFKTVINMFERSDAIHANSLAEYAIAYNYTVLLLNNALEGSTLQETATTIQQYIEKGDANVSNLQYQPSNMARQYFYRAMALSVSGRTLNNVSLEDREAAYKVALAQGGVGENADPQLRTVMMQIRLNYAIFLLISNFPENRDADIVNVLKAYEQTALDPASFKATRASFVVMANAPDSYLKSQILKLAEISPELKGFLRSVGWQV